MKVRTKFDHKKPDKRFHTTSDLENICKVGRKKMTKSKCRCFCQSPKAIFEGKSALAKYCLRMQASYWNFFPSPLIFPCFFFIVEFTTVCTKCKTLPSISGYSQSFPPIFFLQLNLILSGLVV